ncbi:SH3 domain-containing protein [Gemella sp. GH3]|uniref:SH3 domain-containing protein n=1 Tax=unclassified Gemella TaxID=2624949 RepID=UPI0015D044BA|nr:MULTISPECIES: SH3 domain-containing protein [unclassified Gemella]MBF0713596.1 SH3 domain-containing protein [Gemella sp. GH3.1]NYS50548.1 SH3 domain-containing protein [Gemella sp. GH3]
MVTRITSCDWIKDKVDKAIDWDGYYGAQCVDLIMAYVGEMWGVMMRGNAMDYLHNSLPEGFKRYQKGDIEILPGDIVVWYMTMPWGHIGVVIEVDGDFITCVEQNVDGNIDALTKGGPARVVKRDYKNLACIIRPPFEDDSEEYYNYNFIAENGHFTVTVDLLNVRSKPSISSEIVAQYGEGSIIFYDKYCISEGYVWISYLSRTGFRRYVATGRFVKGRNQLDFGTFE